jgi:hypothetical protein
MFKYFGFSFVLFFSFQTFCMENNQSEVSLHDIITVCKNAGNSELADTYQKTYNLIKIDDEAEKSKNHKLYVDAVKKYNTANILEGMDYFKRCDDVIFHDKDNTCAICWILCEKDGTDNSATLLCNHKFHLRCLVNWMTTGNKKTCPNCELKIV